jgi:hypothetical protein
MSGRFLEALPTVATSPLALVGYIALVAAWLAIGWRIRRNKNLLSAIQHIPSRDRRALVEAEMGGIPAPSELPVEQWLRARIHQYYFVGFIVLCVALVLVLALTGLQAREVTSSRKARIDIRAVHAPDTLLPELRDELVSVWSVMGPPDTIAYVKVPNPSENKNDTFDSADAALTTLDSLSIAYAIWMSHRSTRRMNDFPWRDPAIQKQLDSLWNVDNDLARRLFPTREYKIRWNYQRRGNQLRISYNLPYLALLSQGGPIRPEAEIIWTYPQLGVALVNSSREMIYLTEASAEVSSSRKLQTPILLLYRPAGYDRFDIGNIGWGDALDPNLVVQVRPLETCTDPTLRDGPTHHLRLPDIKTRQRIVLTEIIPQASRRRAHACVVGEISYLAAAGGPRQKVAFLTTIQTSGAQVAPREGPGAFYGLWLPAGKAV